MSKLFPPGRRPVDNNLARNERFKDRMALVTGASGPLGRAICLALAKEGMSIACHFHENRSGGVETLELLRKEYPNQRFSLHQADLSDAAPDSPSGIHALLSSLVLHCKRFPDVLICNAGASRRARQIEDINLEDFEHDWKLNTRAPFLLTKHLVPYMRKEEWGRIVYISSIAAYGGGANGCHYASSKGGLTSMAKNLATTLISSGITVNVVSPAFIQGTAMIPRPLPPTVDESLSALSLNASDSNNSAEALIAAQNAGSDPGLALAKTVPAGRLGECSEVADVVVMFCRVGYMTGQDVLLTGGLK